ncbi:hypothetical protein, partial [Kitasatospora sp. NPDC056531]|uniref:hypothetical protein n=1 Tax=Kitasatospora sp. NPDC056531 TaxID=3345856 RepID=UPI003676E483
VQKDLVIDNQWNVLDFAQQAPALTGGNVEFNNTAMFANPVGSTQIAKCNTPSWSGATKGVAFKGCDIVSFPAGTTPVMVGYGDSTDITKVQAAWTK